MSITTHQIKTYIIEDWAGNEIFSPTFESFEEALQWIHEKFPEEEDWEEYYVVDKP